MNRLSFSLIALVLAAPSAGADVLQKSRVPAGVRWLAHLDVEAMKRSKLYEVVHEESGKGGTNEMDEGLAEVRMFAGLDPTMDFKSVTIYCAAQSEKSCVALLAGNEKIDGALEKLKTREHYRTTPVQNYALHTWGGDGDTWYAYVVRKEGSEERVVVASQDTAELVRGIALLERGGESLANASQPAISATPGPGSILFAAAGESLSELGEVRPLSAVAKLAKTIAIDLGEDRGAFCAHVVLDTRTPEDAQRVQQVLQGAVALAGLVGGDENEPAHAKIQKLVDSLHLTLSNTRVDADFRYDVQSLFDDLKSIHDLHATADGSERHRARKHHDKKQEEDR
jgi:hypothetical protein